MKYEIRKPGMTAWYECETLTQARRERRHADSMAGRGHRIIRVDIDGRTDVTDEDEG